MCLEPGRSRTGLYSPVNHLTVIEKDIVNLKKGKSKQQETSITSNERVINDTNKGPENKYNLRPRTKNSVNSYSFEGSVISFEYCTQNLQDN